MIKAVVDAVVSALRTAGMNAEAQYPSARLDPDTLPLICVGIKSSRMLSPGAGDYMGMQTDPDGNTSEIYGLRMEFELGLDVYAGYAQPDGASACLACFGEAVRVLDTLPAGLKLKSFECGEAKPDKASDMFRCRCGIKCAAFFIREQDEEAGEFKDFVLRGVLNNG